MALTQGILKLAVVMDRDATANPIFTFTDSTDYTGNSVTFANVKSALKIEYLLDGSYVTYYNNLANLTTDPDFDGSSAGQTNEDLVRSRTQSTPILLPTDSNGDVISGSYRFTYTVTDGVDTVTNVVTVDCTFTTPTGDLTSTVDVTPTSPSIVVTDETNYVVQNVTPTGTPTITLYYPADAGATATSVTASSLTVTTFYTGQQVAKLSAVKTWDYSGKIDTTATNNFTSGFFTLQIQDTVTARVEIDVEVNNNICALFCCLSAFASRLLAAKSRPSEYAQLKDIAGEVAFYFNSIDAAYQCSKTQNVNLWVNEIRGLVGCDDDCDCDSSAPVQITGIASGSLILGNVISFVTSGTTTSYANNNLIGATYSSTFQSFLVFADGLKATGTFNSATGTFTPTTPWVSGIQIEIVRLRG